VSTSSCVQRRGEHGVAQAERVSRSAGSAATSTALSWLMVWVRALMAEALANVNTPQHLYWPVTGFRAAAGPAAKHRTGGGFGVKGVSLHRVDGGWLCRLG
jgi:hypothetical protein